MTDKPTEKPRWPITAEEWRLLVITFIGGLASILVGAAALGIAVALGRLIRTHPLDVPDLNGWGLVTPWAVLWTLLAVVTIRLWLMNRAVWERVLAFVFSFLAILSWLTWIGLAAGLH
ncbi:MAG: hypothetical protein JWO67_6395 [Streptosporangiaceae bacterium]|nr:hypothetical protein [Streptosporangiaceae bacterium]